MLLVSPADSQLKVWMSKYGWSADESGQIFICSQEESIKPKNIVEKIDFDSECWLRSRAVGPGLGGALHGDGLENVHSKLQGLSQGYLAREEKGVYWVSCLIMHNEISHG